MYFRNKDKDGKEEIIRPVDKPQPVENFEFGGIPAWIWVIGAIVLVFIYLVATGNVIL